MINLSEFRKERIEKLLYELKYELESGFMNGEIDETMSFEFIFGMSKIILDGHVRCKFETRPESNYYLGVGIDAYTPKLKLVIKNG